MEYKEWNEIDLSTEGRREYIREYCDEKKFFKQNRVIVSLGLVSIGFIVALYYV